MKEFIAPILDLIKSLVQPEHSTKFLVTVAGIGGIVYLHVQGISTTSSDIVMAALCAAYFASDLYHKRNKA